MMQPAHLHGQLTRANMIWQMQALVAGVQPGDSLVFRFSGPGMQVPDRTGHEKMA